MDINEDDERKLKNLATRIMSNGVEVLVKDKNSDGKQEQTKYMEVKTIQPTASNVFINNFPKIDKRVDNEDENDGYDFIQPSEPHTPCTTSCSCSHTKTEGLKTKFTNINVISASMPVKYGIKTTNFGAIKFNLRPTNKESLDKKTAYGPYEYESSSQLAPTDRIVEKYTEVISDYSDEKESGSVEQTELLTNEQAPGPQKLNKVPKDKRPEKPKPEKPHKPNKNKFVVADLLKLGSLGIKGLSQLAPVIEKMTGGFMKRQDSNKTSSTSEKPEIKLTPYNVDKRVDSEEVKNSNFPIYIPVDDIETSESQSIFTNATLYQNLVWAADHKQPKARIVPPKMIHESPLVNGGIPISPGEIITANSDVIVGKPAVGGPLTLAASGIKLHNPVNPPPIDSFASGNEHYLVNEPASSDQVVQASQVDDSFDLRPPEMPKPKVKPTRNLLRPPLASFNHQNNYMNKQPPRMPPKPSHNDQLMKTEQIKTSVLGNHGRPAFLDYIPSSFGKPNTPTKHHIEFRPVTQLDQSSEEEDNSPSSSEIINTHIKNEIKFGSNADAMSKPFLVDIQPSRVANVLIPHGSSTALVFAGSSEPHKTGDYVDDPLPYPEPGYFGSFSIDAPQMTNVQNVAPNKPTNMGGHPPLESYKPILTHPNRDLPIRNEIKYKWKDNTYAQEHHSKLPPPTSNQHTHLQVGPQITVYNPDNYKGDFEKYNNLRGKENFIKEKETIDREYENFLAVPPPPPPPKPHFNKEIQYDNNKPYHQRPIVHTKPIQDMKVFLNIQHPIPNNSLKEQPQKVTSEIYFASQMPNNQATPTYTIQIPSSPATFENNNLFKDHQQKVSNAVSGQEFSSFSKPSYPSIDNKTILAHENNDRDSTYTVTLNTATNVANNVGENAQVVGSSIAVPIDSSDLNANIPVGTNFAIKVDDDSSPLQSFNFHEQQSHQIVYDNQGRVPVDVSTEDNRWNKSTQYKEHSSYGTNVVRNEYNNQVYAEKPSKEVRPSITSVNSHANFPMINEHSASVGSNEDIKPVTEHIEDTTLTNQKRPPKLIPNIPTNSHGWYSSGITNKNNINNIQIEMTTRKAIPLLPEYNRDSIPEFGQKINSIGKPPSEFWSHNPQTVNFNIGKPFTKFEKPDQANYPTSNNKPLHINYIPSNIGIIKQPVYDIPIRDNSDETTTVKTSIDKVKPVYETSEEVYDGEENESTGEADEEVSQESMKVPVVSTSDEKHQHSLSKPLKEPSLLRDEVYGLTQDTQTEENIQLVNFNPGTQTEKPFNSQNKNTGIQSNKIKPISTPNHYIKPRPFTINSATTLDHQLQQPHWQINQLMVNSTNMSYEENLDLNTGEEVSTSKPSTPKVYYHHGGPDHKYRKPLRPGYVKPHTNISNIITSTVHIQDKKPLVVEEDDDKSTLASLTTSSIELNRSSSEIIDLSPPPPTMDYNFKPSTNDEMIMGMSPPPPISSGPPPIRNTPTARPVVWSPPTHRPLPIRTPPPYRTKPPRMPTQRPIRKPVRDEVSTYRPSYDNQNHVKRPVFNRDQPSSQLLPPPRALPSRVSPMQEIPVPTLNTMTSASNIVFPTPISSGWLTSSGVDFSSSFGIEPTSVQFPKVPEPSKLPAFTETSSENTYKVDTSSEHFDDTNGDSPVTENSTMSSKEVGTEQTTTKSSASTESIENDSAADESSQEDVSTERNKIFLPNKNRTRKPYPIRHDDRKSSTSKYKLPSKPTSVIRPTRTLTRPEILYPTRQTTTRKIMRPSPTRSTIVTPSVIESSESSIEDEFIRPTEVLKESQLPTVAEPSSSGSIEKVSTSVSVSTDINTGTKIQPTHHAGNEVKISDEIVPTKTEFKTTVVTLTKTLSEPPQTVSSIGYVNLTHTLTVTHTKTSLVSKSEGAITETLVLTNTHTSTIVDVVTEIRTQVQPTTIIETVTKHIPVQIEATPVQEITTKTKVALDDISMSSEEENLIIRGDETTENVQRIESETDSDNDTFFVVMNKSQNGGKSPPANSDIETGDYDGVTRNEQVNSNGVSQVLFGEILLAGTPYLETTNVVNPTGVGYSKECQPDCKASRNERCQRIDGIMKCVCRPGFARMFPDRPCKPTYTYSVKLALGSQGKQRLLFHPNLADNSSKEYHDLAMATHEGINRMVMQSDLRDVFHGVHITGFHEVDMKNDGEEYQGVINNFYVQLSDNAHESRLKEVIEKYLRNNNYSLGGTEVHAASELIDRLDVSDFDECTSGQFHDCSEHAQCFNLRGTYTCSCLEGFADLSVNPLYPGRICSAEPVGCERCNYHGSCYSRDDQRVLCECFQWYAGSSCHINLKVVLISLVVLGALLTAVLAACAVVACSKRPRPPPRSIVTCITGMPGLHQGAMPSKQRERTDRRALINDRAESGDASSVQNASLPYMPAKKCSKKHVISEPPAHAPPPVPAPAVMIPRARFHSTHHDSRDNIARKRSLELSSEAKLISYLESGAAINNNEEMRRKHSMESSYSANKDRIINKQGALVSAGFKVSTTIRPDDREAMKEDRDDLSSVNKADLEAELHFDSLRKSYSQDDMSEWTDAERRMGELTLSEARSVGGTLPASTGRAASSTRLTHQEANTMAERDLGSTFLLPHVHLYKPDITSDVSEFDSL